MSEIDFDENQNENHDSEEPWIIARLGKQLIGVLARQVQTLVEMPDITPIHQMPDYVRGVINLRGNVLPVIDLRVRMGMPSFDNEKEKLIDLMLCREQDHRDWLDSLHDAVENGTQFDKATDPEKCAFGKWYKGYRADSETMARMLEKFDPPHRAIHGIAKEVLSLRDSGRKEEAFELIEKTRDSDLSVMLGLFHDVRETIARSKEIAVVLETESLNVAVSIDAVESIEKMGPGTIEPISESNQPDSGVVANTGRLLRDDRVVYILEMNSLFEEELMLAGAQGEG